MIRGVHLRGSARRELAEIADYLAGRSVATALRFASAVEGSLQRLADSPRIGHPWTAGDALLREVRTWPVAGFENILTLYRPSPRGVEVMRILNSARDLPAILEEE